MKKKTIWTWAIVAICIIILIAIPVSHHFQKIHDLKEQGIYKLITLSPETIDGITAQHSYFMVCEPSDDNAEAKVQIEAFIEENDIIANLEAELAETWDGPIEEVEMHLWFVQPSNVYPIGKFPWNESDFDERACNNRIARLIFQNGVCVHENYLDYSV